MMARQMDIIMLQYMSFIANQRSDNSVMFRRHFCGTQNVIYTWNIPRQTANLNFPYFQKRILSSKQRIRIQFALNPDGFSANGDLNRDNSALGGTRLGRIVGAGGRQLLSKLNSARKNFPMKVFLVLLGFYTANILATILGQTGDWDVLVAGLVVAAIEGIGMVMYKWRLSTGRLQSLVVMVNYWKAGVCLGLFVDAFKLGS